MFGYHTSCQNLLDSQEKTKVQQRSTAVSQASELDKQQVTMRQMQRRIGLYHSLYHDLQMLCQMTVM
jgi:uncharacterized protein involved in exopolysaccharide biosynthesis